MVIFIDCLSGNLSASQSANNSEGGLIRAPAQMWRCSRIMHMLRDLHPTLLSALEGIVDQVCLRIVLNDQENFILCYWYIVPCSVKSMCRKWRTIAVTTIL